MILFNKFISLSDFIHKKQRLKSILILVFLPLCWACSFEKKPLFTLLDSQKTHVDFANILHETEQVNINKYLYACNGGGVAVGDINNDGKPDVYFSSNQSGNKLYLNNTKRGDDINFENITKKAGVQGFSGKNHWTTGIVMVDINYDGWLDIYVSQLSGYENFTGKNLLFINNHDLTFSEKAKDYHIDLVGYCQQAAFFDYDNDGDLDLYQLHQSVHSPEVYLKTALRTERDKLAGDKLLRNDNGIFVDVSEKAGIWGWAASYGLAVGIADLDNNGFSDIYVSNDFHENDYVYFNQGNGRFSENVKEATSYTSNFSMGNDIADLNNDGLLDVMTLDMKPDDDIVRKQSAGADPFDIFQFKLSFGYQPQFSRNMLQLNQGNLPERIGCQFSEIGQFAGVDASDWSWSTLLADFDNDGFKDIFISNGILRRPNDLDYINYSHSNNVRDHSSLNLVKMMPSGAVHNVAYRNQGDLHFKDVSQQWGFTEKGFSMGTAYADVDNDGDLDLIINNLNAVASIYENRANEHTYLKIQLMGNTKNTFGIGSKVEIETENGIFSQTLQPTRGWLSSVDYLLNFGLGDTEIINRLTVIWSDGKTQTLRKVPVNKLVILQQKDAAVKIKLVENQLDKNWQNISEESNINFVHQENPYVDFANERLMPQLLSTQGSKMAVADVNFDGLTDFFIGGASNQSGALYLQVKNGDSYRFVQGNQTAFAQDKAFEDVDARFFDADNDHDLDLLVISGGGQSNIEPLTQDRLYLNDGKGNFSKSANKFPVLFGNKSCVVTADFNHDKLVDIFIGTRSIVKQYGIPPNSYILLNRGKGDFVLDKGKNAELLKGLGMVSSAKWMPQSHELVLAGDWMPITILENDALGNFIKREIKNTSGWWNVLTVCDLDNDGDSDILAGNRGTNSDLRASADQPVTLMVKDFDNSFSTDPIITHFRHGQERLYEGLDELKKQMPMIQNRFHEFGFFARSKFKDIFPENFRKEAIIRKVETFESVQLRNDGQGNYQIIPLPTELQFAPIFAFCAKDFNKDGYMDFVSGGNFSGFKPQIGQMTSSFMGYLTGNHRGDFDYVKPQKSGFMARDEVRDIQYIKVGNKDCLLISNNNNALQLFSRVVSQPAIKVH